MNNNNNNISTKEKTMFFIGALIVILILASGAVRYGDERNQHKPTKEELLKRCEHSPLDALSQCIQRAYKDGR